MTIRASTPKEGHMKILKWRRPGPAVQPDRQCTATTRAGNRCRLAAVPGTGRCPLHKPKAPTTPAVA